MKIFNFFKTHFFSIVLTFVDDFTLNSDNNKEILKFWAMLAFVGLHWPFWPLWPWMIFLSKNWPLLIKIKHNWSVSNNQMSKPITKQDRTFWSTVPHECICGDIVWSVKKVVLIKTGFNYIKKYKIKFDLFLQKKAWKEQLFFQRRWGRQSQQTDQVLPSFVVDNFVSSSDLFFCLSCPQSHYIEVAQKGVSKTQLIVNI